MLRPSPAGAACAALAVHLGSVEVGTGRRGTGWTGRRIRAFSEPLPPVTDGSH